MGQKGRGEDRQMARRQRGRGTDGYIGRGVDKLWDREEERQINKRAMGKGVEGKYTKRVPWSFIACRFIACSLVACYFARA
jgi:hypothetical protein